MKFKFFEWKQTIVETDSIGKAFRAEALTLIDAPYVWGKETPYGTDCSGTICGPLLDMGWSVRTTADMLFHKFFTLPFEKYDKNAIQAIFFLTEVPYDTADGVRPEGTVRHVCPIMGRWVCLHARYGNDIILARTQDVIKEYEQKQCYPELRNIDLDKLRDLDGKYLYGVDDIFQ